MINTNNNIATSMNQICQRTLARMAQKSTDMRWARQRYYDVYDSKLELCVTDAMYQQLKAFTSQHDLTSFDGDHIAAATEALRAFTPVNQ